MNRQPRRRAISLASILFAAIFILPSAIKAQPPQEIMNAAQTQAALKKLTVLGSALYVAAHPDDENTAMLAYLSGERRLRAAYLSVTRGDGGQNLTGTEQGALLGVVRTQELLAARRIDGAEQFFTRAIDFGYSKSPEETLSIWGRDAVLADVVWVIRRFRPDVIITRFPTTGEGGHGQHTASAILAVEAFEAAGDPSRFPEQLKHVEMWRPKRLLWNSFSRGPATRQSGARQQSGDQKIFTIDLGAYNPLLGKSYTEIAANSRSMHKSQGFGSAERRGPAINGLQHLAGEPPDKDFFDGVDLSWRRVPGGAAVGKLLEDASVAFQPANPQGVLPLLVRAYAEMNKLPDGDVWVGVKRRELLNVIRACSGLWIEAVTRDASATPGSEVPVTVTLVNRSNYPLRFESIGMPFGAPERAVNGELKNNQPLAVPVAVRLPLDAEFRQPYWLRSAPGKGIFPVSDQRLVGMPENAPALPLKITVTAGDGTKLVFEIPAVYRWTDRVRGEQYEPFAIVPTATINLEQKVYVFADRQPKPVRMILRSNALNVSGTLRLRVPLGWRAVPESIPVTLKNRNEELRATFDVRPPATPPLATSSVVTLAAEFEDGASKSGSVVKGNGTSGGHTLSRSALSIEHEHIPTQKLFPPAEAKLVQLDLQKRGDRIGYVMGAGDEIPDALRQIGYKVALLSDLDLDSSDLSAFDAIITGVRAYNTRARLRQQQRRLLDYVEAGGTLIVQYNTADDSLPGNLGPYPFTVSRDRVTIEEAPVTLLAPDHPLLNAPNKITAADFDGWIQERGLYFPGEWDARYGTPLATHDPGETDLRGGMLVARYGKGTYIYTGYAWFRQLPAGVPGAYRLFVNMISAGK